MYTNINVTLKFQIEYLYVGLHLSIWCLVAKLLEMAQIYTDLHCFLVMSVSCRQTPMAMAI